MNDMTENSQIEGEIENTAARVAAYYGTLISHGISSEAATEMAALYNAAVLARHFTGHVSEELFTGMSIDLS